MICTVSKLMYTNAVENMGDVISKDTSKIH